MPYLNAIWTALAGRTGIVDRWPDFRFDPRFYARTYPELGRDDATLLRHYTDHGQPKGRYGTYYSLLRRQAPHIDAALDKLITHPDIRTLIDALHLEFEAIKLGAPVDSDISDFSMQAYLRFGLMEGGRRTPADLRKGFHSRCSCPNCRPF